MISLSLNSLFSLKSHGLKKSDIFPSGVAADTILARNIALVESRGQGFLDLVDDDALVRSIMTYAKKVRGKFEHIVVLGIGGSALGVTAVMQVLKPLNWNQIPSKKRKGPQLHVVDNIDPEFMASIDQSLDYPKTLFVVISKSGATPETVAQYLFFKKQLKAKAGKRWQEQIVIITDIVKGFLREEVLREKFVSFPIPDNVGGRFSVLSAVGLVPAALIGVDIGKLLKGAKRGAKQFHEKKIDSNLSYQFARAQYELQQKRGVVMTVMMPYSNALYSIADWYRQLLAESTGKSETRNGKKVSIGLTPIKALGVTDQHSQVQLYNEGPFDKLIVFLETKSFRAKVQIPKTSANEKSFEFLSGLGFGELIHAEQRATQGALTEYDRPTANIILDKIDEEHIGELFVILEGSVAFLGEMYEIDAFNQPGVELAKVLTKKMLLNT